MILLLLIWLIINPAILYKWIISSGKNKYFCLALFNLYRLSRDKYKNYLLTYNDPVLVRPVEETMVLYNYYPGINYCTYKNNIWFIWRNGNIILSKWDYELYLNPLLKKKLEKKFKL